MTETDPRKSAPPPKSGSPISRENWLPEETRLLLTERLPKVSDVYSALLLQDTFEFERRELAQPAEDELKKHLGQIATLKRLLIDFGNDPSSFEVRVQKVSKDEDIYTARVKRISDKEIGVGYENAQIQLSFYLKTQSGVSVLDAISAASLKGLSAPSALRKAQREVRSGSVNVRPVAVCRIPNDPGKIAAIPLAAIEIAYQGGIVGIENMDVYGAKPIGAGHDHKFKIIPQAEDLELKGPQDYEALKELTIRLSGYRPPNRSNPSMIVPKK